MRTPAEYGNGLGIDVDPEPRVSIAHGHEGNCEACTLRIDAGERVHKYADDVVVHECCPGSGERARA